MIGIDVSHACYAQIPITTIEDVYRFTQSNTTCNCLEVLERLFTHKKLIDFTTMII